MNINNSKNNKLIIFLSFGVIIVVSFLIFILNYSKDDSSLSILEKKWVNDNKNKIIDIQVFNDIPIYGLNGSGMIFDILDYFTEVHEIDFNKISYLSNEKNKLNDISFKIVNKGYKNTKKDIELFIDNYVLVSLDDVIINNIKDINNKKIGLFNDDISIISNYLSESQNSSYQPFNKIEDMVVALNNKEIDYLAIPHNMYLNYILSNNYTIVYHIDEIYKKYILTIDDKNFLNVMKKLLNVYNIEHKEIDFNRQFLDTFFTYKNISEEKIQNYNTTSYKYGFVINMPYENLINGEFVGILSNYLSEFNKITNIDFDFIKYNSVKDLVSDFQKGELDIIFSNYKLDKLNIDIKKSISITDEKYVILSKNDIIVNSIKSLEGYKIDVVKDTYLYDLLNDNKIDTRSFDNTDDLIRNIRNDSIIILDYHTYNYYKNSKFKNYIVLYDNFLNNDYNFIIKDINNNNTFYELFNYYISTYSFKKVQNVYNTDYVIKTTSLYSLLFKLSLILLFVGVIILFVFKFVKKDNITKKITKEDKLKYIDSMTSLKNRNYLNYNIKKWDDNIIYPQSIVIIDLNNIKYINDNYGHEEGDEVIKKAAGILIVNQRENTDIIRTDGNEFLIYMVGYSENEVISYTRKIMREIKELPYGFGATIGYSMILDDVKSIDDAINEATLQMSEAKEKL